MREFVFEPNKYPAKQRIAALHDGFKCAPEVIIFVGRTNKQLIDLARETGHRVIRRDSI